MTSLIKRQGEMSMKCDTCGLDKKDVKPAYSGYGMYAIPTTEWICSSCRDKAIKLTAEIEEKRKWKGKAACPACKSKLREEGDTKTSITDVGQLFSTVKSAFDFHPGKVMTRFFTGMGKAIYSIAKGEENARVRQCSKCEAYAAKCPKCTKIFIVGKPKLLDGVSAKCPKCGQRVIAYQ